MFSSFYMLTYSGRVESGDSLTLLDAASSLVQFGDLYLDLSAWFNPPQAFKRPDAFYPLQSGNIEPLPLILAAPLFWLADNIPGIGLVHSVWLLNILVSAAAVGVLFIYALALGYYERTATIGAILFGSATILWPYSKSLFREPLLLLMLVLSALSLERWRAGQYRSPRLLLFGFLAFVGALFTKESALFALPALVVIALPNLPACFTSKRWRRIESLCAIAICMILIFISFAPRRQIMTSLPVMPPREVRFMLLYFQTGVHTYLFSIGGSIWGTSPVVLLALPGGWLLWRHDERRHVWVMILIVAMFAVVHAVLRGQHWFGGLSWPPRFLVPVMPFLIIGLLPLLDKIMRRTVSAWLVLIAAALAVYSLWIQFTGVSLWWGEYAGALPPESGQVLEWSNGLNQLQYLRWLVIPGLWSSHALDFAWVRTGIPAWPVAFGLLTILSAVMLWKLLRADRPGGRRQVRILALLPVIWLVIAWLGLRAIDTDPLYLGANESLHAILPIIEAETRSEDVVLLNSNIHDPSYERFFINHSKVRTARIITLPPQPGEQPSPEQPPQVVSENTEALLTNLTVPLIQVLASTRDRLWVLSDSGPFIPWSVRPVERFMAAHYYPVRELSTDPPDPEVRLLEYVTVSAPDPVGFRGPEHLTDLVYGDSLQLVGYTLPSGTSYTPGQALPLSLYWQAVEAIEQDYTIAWFLADANGAVATQGMDSYPMAGFEHTSHWRVNIPVWDNRALWLPANLQPGSYQLWVKVYTFGNDGAVQDLPVTGGNIINDTIGVLPTPIEIMP